MRIVGGTLGGRVLRAPSGAQTRPTSEKVREALFQILGSVEGDCVLDLFAGSGAVGIEALSRGAAHATFVDSAKPALAIIRQNLAALGLGGGVASLEGRDVLAALPRLAPPAPYRFVFIDPPYASDLAVRAAAALTNLAEDAVVAIEHDRRNAPPEAVGSLVQTDQRRYGDTLISFYRRPA